MTFLPHSVVCVCIALAVSGLARNSAAQEVMGVIGSYYPTQLVRGETTVLRIALGRNNPIQSIEITPPAGVAVGGMKDRDLNQGSVWWEVAIAVAQDAAPGPRTLVVVQRTGRTAPVTLTIPDHLPAISSVRVVAAQATRPTIDVQFNASNPGGTFGESPYVWFLLACGPGQPEAGVVRGKVEGGVIHARIPNPRTLQGRAGAPAAGNRCELQLRATDSSNTDSNTATTTFDVT